MITSLWSAARSIVQRGARDNLSARAEVRGLRSMPIWPRETWKAGDERDDRLGLVGLVGVVPFLTVLSFPFSEMFLKPVLFRSFLLFCLFVYLHLSVFLILGLSFWCFLYSFLIS